LNAGITLAFEGVGIHYGALEILTARAAEETAIIMRGAANGGELHLCGLTTPLTQAAPRSSIYSYRLAKFIL